MHIRNKSITKIQSEWFQFYGSKLINKGGQSLLLKKKKSDVMKKKAERIAQRIRDFEIHSLWMSRFFKIRLKYICILLFSILVLFMKCVSKNGTGELIFNGCNEIQSRQRVGRQKNNVKIAF